MCQGNCGRSEKMNKQNKPCVSNRPSIYYWWRPDEGISSELSDFVLENDSSNTCYAKRSRDDSTTNKPKSSEILSTAQVISIFGQVLNLASRPFTFFQRKRILNQDNDDSNEVTFNSVVEVNGKTPEIKNFCVDIRTDGQCSPLVQPTLGLNCLTVTQKMSLSEPCKYHSTSSFWSLLNGGSDMSAKSWKGKGLTSVRISHDMGKIYAWMNRVSHTEACYPVKVANTGSMKANAFKARDGLHEAGGCISGDSSFLVHELISETSRNAPIFQSINVSSLFTRKLEIKMIENVYMPSRILMFVQDNKADSSIVESPSADILAAHSVPSKDGASDKLDYGQKTSSREQHENKTKKSDNLNVENEYSREDSSLTREKSCYTIAKQEHAFAGALAGVFVSLCLHPVDTIKTVVQSYHAKQKSLSYIGKSIVSDRGLSGLYRGISTNIASSAPISAVYTFTYESVKGALLPLLQEEYRSIVHCVAGGCASIATSFLFTPSERIKQQMQVSAQYHNCWNAFVGVVAKGGLRGLYTGWGAVLCRNVPHSIIKFYTYESLKGLMKSNAQQTTAQTLVCGGVAGSTAALFTTPFDVVKTRLQTQIPGSLSPYKSVIQALYEIGKKEGLKGLYRGLTPRLVMYMSQGAIFFSSYEFLKRLFSLELPRHDTARVQH
ncbi:calcium-binding mitochondrial carrier protein [Benincasa hispida]|uniref:calcium-binding mitochondrial carrier protein n=1 Tax=Benincasa hispida TaxID=102211 RepID=UPI0018FFA1E8|nr:calcium-binding mitochondrial carrier protein [Benincasa hispida]XP_038876201.1 calcium-binding mitochondrial carrier protein [Benincasa hispida]XP_038876202.1 calcium-binding mitochondrial carrier protein [Benincasa hispida]